MLPNLIVIGSLKSGTTSLHYYLSLHPEIQMSNKKELRFFIEKEVVCRKRLRWYEAYFYGESRIHGESSPIYATYPENPDVPERMHSLIPKAKLIYLVRDPVERVKAHYAHRMRLHCGDGPPLKKFADFDRQYMMQLSRYSMQLKQYLRYFSLSSILVISSNELFTQREPTLQSIFRFLRVDDKFTHPEFSTVLNAGLPLRKKKAICFLNRTVQFYRLGEFLPKSFVDWSKTFTSEKYEMPDFPPSLIERMRDYFKDDVKELRRITGKPFKEWCL